jgi:hypothetical protein
MAKSLQFSLRSLLGVTVICALVIGWWCDRYRLNRELQRERETRRKLELYLDVLQRVEEMNPVIESVFMKPATGETEEREDGH